MPAIRTQWSYAIAFMFPAALMVVAFAIFAAGKRFYAPDVITRVEKTPEERQEQWSVLGRLFTLFLLITFFWAIFDQSATTWIFFANDQLNLNILGMDIDPDAVQAFNPLFIMIFLPLITALWAILDARGIKVRATDKILVGFLLTAVTMGVHAFAAYLVDTTGEKVSLWWQVIAYLILTWAEILISVTGLELAFTAAPKNMKGFITACWLLTVGIANLAINAPVTRLYPTTKGSEGLIKTPFGYFSLLTVTMLVVSVAFVFVARGFNRRMALAAAEDNAQLAIGAAADEGPSDAIRAADPGQYRQGSSE